MLDRGARSLTDFCTWAGIGKTKAYEEIKAGRLKVRKLGAKTLVLDEDARAWLASLPETSSSQQAA